MSIVCNWLSRSLSLPALLLLLAVPFEVAALPADLTRHLDDYVQGTGPAAMFSDNFFGTAGAATLRVTNGVDSDPATKVTAGTIELNGIEVLGPNDFQYGTEEIEIEVNLIADNNAIVVELACDFGNPVTCAGGSQLRVRVKQTADETMDWGARVHFNTNISSYAVSRQFYTDLGFITGVGFPDTNTLEVARSIGVQTPTTYDGSQGPDTGGYLLHGQLIALTTAAGTFIDLIEFTIPRNDEPPYPHVYHLGMARAVFFTTDLDSDYVYISGVLGAEFLGPPATRSNGIRFAIFKDPDGTFYELQEVVGLPVPGIPTNITSIGPVVINVSDFERSRAFYKMLGFEVGVPIAETDSLAVAQSMGLTEPYQLKGELLTAYGSNIELVQWISPYDPERAYDLPINHFGINRIAFTSSDLEGDVAALKAQGVEFISPIAACCSGPDGDSGIVGFFDPDGTVIELTGSFDNPPQEDTDGDGLNDREDNCIEVANADQCDTNSDGYGNACDPDLNNSGVVNFEDLSIMKEAFFGTPGDDNWNADSDLTCNDTTNFVDLAIMKEYFFSQPGPSGIVGP